MTTDDMTESPNSIAEDKRDDSSADRRQSQVALKIPERRSGFDRRLPYHVTGHFRDNPSSLLIVLITINVLSLFDFAFTWVQLSAGVSVEANPLLALLYLDNPLAAWLFKTCVVLAVSFAIWHARRYRAILAVALLALTLYLTLFIYHIWGMKVTGLI